MRSRRTFHALLLALTTAVILIGTAAAQAGTIEGAINFDGKARHRRPIDMSADPNCQKAHGDEVVLEQRYELSKDEKHLPYVFVYISDGLKGDFKAPEKEAEIDQKGCTYAPHVVGLMVGQKLKLFNSDNTLHNVNCKPDKNNAFNRGMGPGTSMDVSFEKPEMGIPVKCDVHPWMSAYIQVMENPFFAVSDENGKYKIENVPPGKYQVTVWYESSKYKPDQETQEIEVKGDAAATLDFTYKRD